MKGRRTRKVFDQGLPTLAEKQKRRFALERLEQHDKEYEKFLEKRERHYAHH